MSTTKSDVDENAESLSHSQLLSLYRNISRTLDSISRAHKATTLESNGTDVDDAAKVEVMDDSANAYLYILFVLMFYAFSIVILMIKYIKREREGSKLEYYYNEFVKRDW